MKFRIYAFFLLIFFPYVAFSKNDTDFNIENVCDILSQMSSRYKKYKNIKVTFLVKKYDNEEPEKYEQHNGIFITKLNTKDNIDKYKYWLKINEENLIVTDGETKWIYNISINEVTITENNLEDEEEKIFNTFKNLILKNPTEFLAPVLFEEKEKTQIIELIPYEEESQSVEEKKIDETLDIDRIVLEIDTETKALKSFRIDTEDGNHIVYYITNTEFDLEITDNFFKFHPKNYNNIIINDIR